MHQHVEFVVLILLVTNAVVCASVPQSVKDKVPLLFEVLDAIAVNIGHAKNEGSKAKPWHLGVTTSLVAALFGYASYVVRAPVQMHIEPGAEVSPVSDVADGVSLSDAVSPAQDVSAVSPTAD
jgi:hypothetical protein